MLIANYITSAWRNILRHKLFSVINILGLAIGLAAVMLIALYVQDELSYDESWAKADRIYRLHVERQIPDNDPEFYNAAPPALAESFKNDFPEIEHLTRISARRFPVRIEDKMFDMYLHFTEPDILEIFDFDVIQGDLSTALNTPNGFIIDREQAEKFYGDENPIGKVITLEYMNTIQDLEIMAVIENSPENSILRMPGLALMQEQQFRPNMLNSWYRNQFFTYFTVKPGTDINELSSRFPDFVKRHFPQAPFAGPEISPDEHTTLSAMNIKDLHLKTPGTAFEMNAKGSMTAIYSFLSIAFLILVIASINFMNLSTARASRRAKEVSIRKALGASRFRLIIQFVGESILLTFFALIIAICLLEISLPFYNDFMNKNIALRYLSSDMAATLFFAFLIGALGGIYPAMVLSRSRPAETLMANQSNDTKSSTKFRSVLVIVQFTISIALFISTGVIFGQIDYIQEKDMGYNKENLVSFYGNDHKRLIENLDTLMSQIRMQKNVVAATQSDSFYPGSNFLFYDPIRTERKAEYDPIMIGFRQVGYDFLKTFDIPLLAGRDYERGRNDIRPPSEVIAAGNGHVAGLLINRSAVEKLNFGSPEEAIGRMMYMNVGQLSREGGQEILEAEFKVIGVIDDIHFNDLKYPLGPELYQLYDNRAYFIIVRYTGDPMTLVGQIEAIWNEILPGSSFAYHFADDAILRQYQKEQSQMTMFAAFSGLAIFIACLGLFGLASFTAERRTKEIGIRKVFGAEVFQIVRMLVFQFSKPVLIANIIAWPIAYLAMSRWLESFVYRIDDMVIIALCLIAGLSALLIAWATVAGNSYAVARQNPIKALRYE